MTEQDKIARIYALAEKLHVKLAPETPETLRKEKRAETERKYKIFAEISKRGCPL